MNEQPLVSAVITTKNEEKNIKNVLESLKQQAHKNVEIIVVDNNSTDKTKEIARQYTSLIYNKGPERSSQRNFGVKMAKGEYILILDADMILSEKVIENCLESILKNRETAGFIIPEISIGEGFWAKCKALEKGFYVGIDYMEAARFYRKDIFEELGGFDVNLVSGEDWDLSQRAAKKYKLGRIKSHIYHNEGRLTFGETLKTKFYYAKNINKYLEKNQTLKNAGHQINIFQRFKLYFSHPAKLFKNPAIGIGMLFMKLCEFGSGGIGYLMSKFKII